MAELTWEGKYDAQGRKVAPLRIALPFQTVETVNESAAARDLNHELFASGRPTEWRNRLIWGDKKYVLPSLLEEFAGKVNLIYIDPPFATGGDFSFTATVPDDPDTDGDQGATFVKQPSVIEQKAYRDTWGTGLDGYVAWFYQTVALLRDLLAEDGCLFVHLDWHVGHYAKLVLDELFGFSNFRNEIIWKRSTNTGSSKVLAKGFSNDHDTLLLYSKSERFTSNKQFVPHNPEYVKSKFKHVDDRGPYQLQPLVTVSEEKLAELRAANMVVEQEGKYLRYKQYLDTSKGKPVSDLWMDLFAVNSQAEERMNYPTQKPEALLERIIKASSNEADLVLDCFGGSGTTASVAEKLGRRWVTCDLGRFAIHTTRKRLLGIPGIKPFVVQNLGKYERQAWAAAEFGESAEEVIGRYRRFVLELYHAQPVTGFLWLHGTRRGRMVHVGGVDAPVTLADVTGIVTEFRKAVGGGKDAPERSGVDVLGWDFAFELNETARHQAEQAGIDLKLIRIPREVLEQKAVEQGDIKFFELAALGVKLTKKARKVTLALTDFIIPLDDVPEEVQQAVTHWEQWIDYWAVDWNNSDDTFHNEWQSYRTRKEKTLERQTTHTYQEPGTYRVVVKVIDILGNDTTKLLTVEVK